MYAISTKLNKVFRSTLAAENLALDEDCETGIYVSKILEITTFNWENSNSCNYRQSLY